MSSLKKIIERLYAEFPLDTLKRGNAFEKCCKWFLMNDPRYSTQLKNVWLWHEWPGNWGRDKGIDLIAETHCGKIWAIQAKAYNENYHITKEDVDKFLSESSRKEISFRLLIATTNNIGHNAQEVINAQEKPFGLCLLDSLQDSTLNWLDLLNKPNAIPTKQIKIPQPHQEQALQDILTGFERSPYGQVHMACGTGKTLIGLWLAIRLKSRNTLVLLPSISLVAQLYKEWANNADDFIFDPIFVCSDATVNKAHDDDSIYFNSAELGYPVTTNADEILKQYLQGIRPKVIFATYHSSHVLAEACSKDSAFGFDLALADEAHRCAGPASSSFATIVDKYAIKTKYKLFMTATPKIFSNHVKQKTQEAAYEIVSMDDEEKFGPVFHKLLFSDAIREGLLSDYRVIISIMDNALYRKYTECGRFVSFENYKTDARTLASQLLVAKVIKKFGLKKIISFHNRKKSAQEFITTFSKALQLLSDDERPCISLGKQFLVKCSNRREKRF